MHFGLEAEEKWKTDMFTCTWFSRQVECHDINAYFLSVIHLVGDTESDFPLLKLDQSHYPMVRTLAGPVSYF